MAYALNLRADDYQPPKVPTAAERRALHLSLYVALIATVPLLLVIAAFAVVAPPLKGFWSPFESSAFGHWLADLGWWLPAFGLGWVVIFPVLLMPVRKWRVVVVAAMRLSWVLATWILCSTCLVLAVSWVGEVAPVAIVIAVVVVVLVFAVISVRLIPAASWRGLALWGVPLLLGGLTFFFGDALLGEYLAQFDLRPTDVTTSGADRWFSGIHYTGIALAGGFAALAFWGLFRRLGILRSSVLAWFQWAMLVGLAILYLLMSAQIALVVARNAAKIENGAPGSWPGVAPTWVCWRPESEEGVPFVGAQLPPRDVTVLWLGAADGRYALWSEQSGGVRVPDDVTLMTMSGPGPCR
ncbi:hypothetical protein [Amycolatopsis thermoflava]|uniref:hypothetical protein n=1 Tax=Amycolatopsis thermoflava TaxID=84480 RepID=UPI003EBB7242